MGAAFTVESTHQRERAAMIVAGVAVLVLALSLFMALLSLPDLRIATAQSLILGAAAVLVGGGGAVRGWAIALVLLGCIVIPVGIVQGIGRGFAPPMLAVDAVFGATLMLLHVVLLRSMDVRSDTRAA